MQTPWPCTSMAFAPSSSPSSLCLSRIETRRCSSDPTLRSLAADDAQPIVVGRESHFAANAGLSKCVYRTEDIRFGTEAGEKIDFQM